MCSKSGSACLLPRHHWPRGWVELDTSLTPDKETTAYKMHSVMVHLQCTTMPPWASWALTLTAAWWWVKRYMGRILWAFLASHRHSRLSLPPLASWQPTGDHVNPQTSAVWRRQCPDMMPGHTNVRVVDLARPGTTKKQEKEKRLRMTQKGKQLHAQNTELCYKLHNLPG